MNGSMPTFTAKQGVMMSKKDYEAIAAVLNTILRTEGSCSKTVTEIAAALGVVFGKDNPRFQYERFVYAALKKQGDK
jgi:hypothetical protein